MISFVTEPNEPHMKRPDMFSGTVLSVTTTEFYVRDMATVGCGRLGRFQRHTPICPLSRVDWQSSLTTELGGCVIIELKTFPVSVNDWNGMSLPDPWNLVPYARSKGSETFVFAGGSVTEKISPWSSMGPSGRTASAPWCRSDRTGRNMRTGPQLASATGTWHSAARSGTRRGRPGMGRMCTSSARSLGSRRMGRRGGCSGRLRPLVVDKWGSCVCVGWLWASSGAGFVERKRRTARYCNNMEQV